jgi:tetratricopeptide (TPR) repeat protein
VGYGHECLGKIHYNLGEYEEAYEHLIQGEDRNPCGFYYLGRLYDEGLGVELDRDKAIELYQKAVESGLKYEKEYGEDEDCVKAKERLKEFDL